MIERIFYIKLFGDFIKKKIGNHKIKITLVDFENFIVIKGQTTSDVVLNMSELVDEFKTFHDVPKNSNFNTIDILEYNKPVFFSEVTVIRVS